MINKEIITLSLKLLIITAIATLLLAVVNKVTLPVIEANNAKSFSDTQAEVLPEASEFKKTEFSDVKIETTGVKIDSFNVGLDGKDVVGYVVSSISTEAYGGELKVMVGIDKNMKVTKVKIIESSETPGLGAKASEPKFIEQFYGKSKGLSVVKNQTSADNQVEAISGATITSRAVTKAVDAALELVSKKADKGLDAASADEVKEKVNQVKEETEKQMSDTDNQKEANQ